MNRSKQAVAVVATLMMTLGSTAALACGGNACQPYHMAAPSTFNVGANAGSTGFGMSTFQGQQGYNMVEKAGYSGVDVSLQAAGNLCGADCRNGAFTAKAYAGEHVTSQTGAMGNLSGVPVTAFNATGAAAAASITVPTASRYPRH